MTQDEIIEMAEQAGFTPVETSWHFSTIEAFAKLVASKEREACAKSLEEQVKTTSNFQAEVLIEWCATHIRARGETTLRGEA